VSQDRKLDIFGAHARVVIAHKYTRGAILAHLDLQAGGTGIECILEEFLDHRGWPVNHPSSDDLLGY
jgi:hypothetical protein